MGTATARVIVFAVAGVAFGVVTSVVNVSGLPVVPKVIGVGWCWAAIGVLAAAMTRRRQTLTVLLVLVAAVAGYYVSDLILGVYNGIDFSDPVATSDPSNAPQITHWWGAVADFATWSVCALIVSWPLARIGVATRRDDRWGLAARLVVPLGAVTEMLAFRLPAELAVQPSGVTVATYLTVAGLGIGASIALWLAQVRRSLDQAR